MKTVLRFVLGFFKEAETTEKGWTSYETLVHMTGEAEKSQDPSSVIWSFRKADVELSPNQEARDSRQYVRRNIPTTSCIK